MFTVYVQKRKIIRLIASMALIGFGIFVGIFVILTCVDISAAENTLPIYRVRTDSNKIALTFDVAWGNEDTQQIIDILNEFDVKATFFITGDWAEKFPQDVKAYFDNGHEIANHSDTHPYPTQISMNDLINDTRSSANKLKAITGVEPKLYRAPYGDYNETVVSTINGMGYDIIQWDCDTLATVGVG